MSSGVQQCCPQRWLRRKKKLETFPFLKEIQIYFRRLIQEINALVLSFSKVITTVPFQAILITNLHIYLYLQFINFH